MKVWRWVRDNESTAGYSWREVEISDPQEAEALPISSCPCPYCALVAKLRSEVERLTTLSNDLKENYLQAAKYREEAEKEVERLTALLSPTPDTEQTTYENMTQWLLRLQKQLAAMTRRHAEQVLIAERLSGELAAERERREKAEKLVHGYQYRMGELPNAN